LESISQHSLLLYTQLNFPSCEDLFDSDVQGENYNVSIAPGSDDWPYINVYGSCKTCDAYILDYFAEEAFEEIEHFKKQSLVYFAGFLVGMLTSLTFYAKHRARPAVDNEIELLSCDGGVIA
jgi:hypothetical protein